jgi:hypothetical protein
VRYISSIFIGIDGIGRLMGTFTMFEWMRTMAVEQIAEERLRHWNLACALGIYG